ncbi:MAG: hypothetical protein ACHRHE_14060 [Tepidisphaerales bacterium]
MAVQTLKLGGRKYVLLPESEYRRLSDKRSATSAEDQRDATILRRRLAEMRRRGEKPMPYAQARRELGLA